MAATVKRFIVAPTPETRPHQPACIRPPATWDDGWSRCWRKITSRATCHGYLPWHPQPTRDALESVEGFDVAGHADAIGLGWILQQPTPDAPLLVEKTGADGGFADYIALLPQSGRAFLLPPPITTARPLRPLLRRSTSGSCIKHPQQTSDGVTNGLLPAVCRLFHDQGSGTRGSAALRRSKDRPTPVERQGGFDVALPPRPACAAADQSHHANDPLAPLAIRF